MSRIVIVTGGTRGIGRAICEEFIKNGDIVVLNYKKSYEKAVELKEKLGENLYLIQADVGNMAEVKVMTEFCLNKFGKVDVLVNNAGISQIKPFADITEDDANELLEMVEEKFEDCDVELNYGGQPVYYYIVSVE